MKLENEELRACLERIQNDLNLLEDHENESNEFHAIHEVLQKFENLKIVISQERGMKLKTR